MKNNNTEQKSNFKFKVHEIIFEADTKWGRIFDETLIVLIILSVIAVMLDSVKAIRLEYGEALYIIEWAFTILFSIEYLFRLYCVGRPMKYAGSFYGIVDLLAILPTYISLILPGTQLLIIIRILRVLRVFRVFKIVQYIGEIKQLKLALIASRRKITVFLFVVLTIAVVVGSLIYLIEGEENGFTSIPKGIYWSIVTLTTVGYGDISPQTEIGQLLAAMLMIMGYGIIAVPTGIVTVEMGRVKTDKSVSTRSCLECSAEGHEHDAVHCKFCGAKL
ncbi:MAG: ion transporter [Ignavibacteriae bacterium]|nr:ion transporter [Ignavibacteriota bacterium]NOG98376.1 ion transporter [Ignavibacteriota bacterium]